jgi:plasmid stability protein
MVLALAKAGLKNTRRRTRILVRSVMPSTVWGFWIGIFRSDDACKLIILNNLHILPQSHAIREPRRLHLVFNAVIDYN